MIVTPLGYLGQKIGIVFAMQGVKKGDEEARKSDVKQLEKKFNDISKEFSPLLFHSLQAKTYHEALNSLKYRDPREAIDILCEAFAAVFNVTAIVFHVNDNRIVYGFESSDEGVILSRLDSNKHDEVMKELIHDGDSNTAASLLNGNAYGVKAYNFDGTVYTSKEDESKRIRTRSRLLLKINPSDFDKLPVNEGILDIFFDLSEYSLRRNASDIVREIEFIADLIFEAARQKYALMQKSLITAVSAIMGRNMSHNIGSHVLARYSSAVGRVGEQRLREEHLKRIKTARVDKEEFLIETAVGRGEDHRAVFLRYLQRRMDFVAEVATAEKSFWSQPLSLCGVLSALDLEAEKRRINEDSDSIRYKPILLSYITGKEGMDATVDSGAIRDDPYFTCPGGEVGAHALYVILENIIRNSARHNMGQQKRVKLEVRVEDEDGEDHNDLWCITIIDCQSNTEKVADINRIINTERILKHDGSPNPKCWGIREMQICAQYLRGLPMSELEGKQPNPPVLEAVPRPNESGNDCLAYRIYLQRAKFCALLPARATLKDAGLFDKEGVNELNKKLKPKGIVIFRSSPDASRLQGYSFVIAEAATTQVIGPEDGKEAVLRLKRNGEEKSIPWLHLPVRTMLVDSDFMKVRLNELRTDKESKGNYTDNNPEIWLEPLHRRLWKTYRDKRKDWKGKPIKVLVGWETEAESNNECERIQFCHTMKVNANNTYKYFGTAVQNAGAIGIIWVDHGGATDFRPNSVPSLRSAASLDPGRLYRPIVFAELVESLRPHKPLLEKQKNNVIKGNELVAAALARVIVLDERVQNEMAREYRAGLDYKTLWPCMGIWVPEGATDLNHPNFRNIREFLMKPAQIAGQFPPDFLVLHLTILENLRKQCGHDCEADTLQQLLADTCADPAKYGCEIIIVTGRGVPSLNRLRYLPISALLEYLMARPSKLALMRALWSAATAN
ncbi:MAG TPA: hypothetical protein ENN18_08900 [Proteobacteria bacterium]|nr:hypothetical protein [Pseudomonadota bacterium]